LTDEHGTTRKLQKELKSGTVSLVLLAILNRTRKPMYGYEITKHIDSGTEQTPKLSQGALYPVLRSLEKSELLSSRVEPSVSGPPRKYYQITDLGRATLEEWSDAWVKTRDFVDVMLKGTKNV
jgi:PadR family transcriptional regulator